MMIMNLDISIFLWFADAEICFYAHHYMYLINCSSLLLFGYTDVFLSGQLRKQLPCKKKKVFVVFLLLSLLQGFCHLSFKSFFF